MSNYWQKRFQAVEEMNNKRAKETVRAITPAFDKAQAQIEKEINAWYARFAKNNEISLADAKKLLNSRELKEFRWDVEEYIKYGRQNALDQAWMKQLENASSRFHISRLEALKIRTQNAAERAFGNELDALDDMAARMYTDTYYHTAYEIQRGLGIGWDVGQIDQRKLDKIVSKPWTTDKMTFSDRIWKSKTQLVDSLHTELTQMCVLGKAPDAVINNIAKRMDVSKGQAGRLVMTEAAYFGSVAQKDCFNELDVEKYEIVATLDNKTSEVCQEMDGKVFDMKDFEAGVTAPPFHVWCRSCTCPYFDDDEEGTRAARDADGRTYYVPSDMKYEDWKKSFVGGGSKDDLEEYMSHLNSLGLGDTKPISHTLEELKDLELYANEKGIKVFQIQKFDGDSKLLKEQIDVLGELKHEYKYPNKLTISFSDLGKKDLALVSKSGRNITFNNLALRDREVTNAYLRADSYLSATDIKGIASHEMGHVLQKVYGNKVLDIAQKVCYNLNGESLSYPAVVEYLRNNISDYSIVKHEQYIGKPMKQNHFKEAIPEILSKHFTNPDEFTTEFIKLLKEVWKK